jgi:uncharacterized protein YuzE
MYKRILNWDYDPKRDIIFIFSFDEYDYQKSIRLKNMTVDLNPKGKAVALEILDSAPSLVVEPESLICPEDFLIDISGKNWSLNVNATFKLTSEQGLINRTLREEAGIEQKFIIKNILKPYTSYKIK